MNDSASLSVAYFIIFIKHAIGAFASYIYKTRSASSSHLRGVWTKRATVNDAFHYFMKRATGSGALPFVYLKFYNCHY
jgi:hypothetical protein